VNENATWEIAYSNYK